MFGILEGLKFDRIVAGKKGQIGQLLGHLCADWKNTLLQANNENSESHDDHTKADQLLLQVRKGLTDCNYLEETQYKYYGGDIKHCSTERIPQYLKDSRAHKLPTP